MSEIDDWSDMIEERDDYDDFVDDEDELIIVCPDDMCRGSFDGEGPPCGVWRDSCVRFKNLPTPAPRDEDTGAASK